MGKHKGVFIVGEGIGDKLHQVTYELLKEGRRLADILRTDLSLILVGPPESKEQAEELPFFGADKVILVLDPALKDFRDDIYSRIICNIIQSYNPEIVLFSATSMGQALAPRVAGKLRVGLTAHCIGFEIREEDRALVQIRPSFGEDIMAKIVSLRKPQMATVRPGVFSPALKDSTRKGRLEYWKISSEDLKSQLKIIKRISMPQKGKKLSSAKIVVSGGRGLGDKKTFEKLYDLAQLLDAGVGATRPVCHLGWASEDQMIGVSGISISPKLYIGLGISGSLHHMVGIRGAETIVAINKDPEAPLMKRAQIAVIGDVKEILPLLIQRIRDIKGERNELKG